MNERLRALREAEGLSRAEFGSRIGVSGDVINNLERGRVDFRDSMVKLICSEYHVREEWLRTGAGEMRVPDVDSELDALCDRYDLGQRSRVFIKTFAELSDDEQDVILDYIMKVADAIRSESPSDADLHDDLQREIDLQKKQADGSTGSDSTAV